MVARKEIRSVPELRASGSPSRKARSAVFLSCLLRDAGLSAKDVRPVNMSPAMPAPPSWRAASMPPSRGSRGSPTAGRRPTGTSSSTRPDAGPHHRRARVFRQDVIEKRPREIQGVVDAWHKAVAYWQKNPAESNQIMARAVGEWLQDPRLFADVLTGVRFYDQLSNTRFFGTPRILGALYKVIENAMAIAAASGQLRGAFTPRDLVNHAFVR